MLRLANFSAGYHKDVIIKNINATFQPSTITSIIGPNGSGKSTLLKSIAGLCNINSGNILLDTCNLTSDITQRSKLIAYMAQTHTAPSLTVERTVLHGRFPYLSYPRHYTKEDLTLCHNALRKVGIYELRNKYAKNLSGGELQKVYLAMIMVSQASVYLFDEPNTFLDIRYQLDLFKHLKKIRSQSKIVIAVLHNLDYALQISDQILVINHGTITAHGTPEEVYHSKIINKTFGINCEQIETSDNFKHYFIH